MATIGDIVANLKVDQSAWNKGLRSASSDLGRFGKKTNKLRSGLNSMPWAKAAAGIAGIGLAAGRAVQIFAGFSDKLSKVRAITGATGADFEALKQKAKDLGSSTAFTASEVADAMSFLGQAGFTTEQILGSIEATLQTASAGGIELAETADILSDVGTAMGFLPEEFQRVADVLAKTASSANTNISMMGETMQHVAPIAKSAGQSLEEVSAAAGILANAGIKGSMAGTDLKNVLTVLAKSSEVLGVKTQDAAGNVRPMLEIMKELGETTKGMSSGEKVTAFVDTFGKISAKSAINLAEMAEQGINLKTSLENASGTAAEMAEVMQDNVGGSFRKLNSAIEGLQIAIGEGLAPIVSTVADMITEMTQDTTSGVAKTGDQFWYVARAVGGIGDAIVGFRIIFKGVQSFVTTGISNWLVLFEGVAKAIDWIAEQTTGTSTGIGATIAAIREDLNKLSGEQWDEAGKMLDAELPSTRIMREFEEAQKKAAETAGKTIAEETAKGQTIISSNVAMAATEGLVNGFNSAWDFIKDGAGVVADYVSESLQTASDSPDGPSTIRRNSKEFFEFAAKDFGKPQTDEQKKTNSLLEDQNKMMGDFIEAAVPQAVQFLGLT